MLKQLAMVALASACALNASAANTLECHPLIKNYSFMLDVSGSMMLPLDEQTDQKRIDLSKQFIRRLVEHVEVQHAQKNLLTLAPYTEFFVQEDSQDTSRTFEDAVQELQVLETVGRPTWLGQRAVDRLTASTKDRQTVILITDGDIGQRADNAPNPKDVFAKFKQNGNRLFVISLAESEQEREQLQRIFPENTPIARLRDLMDDQVAFDRFVNQAFPQICRIELSNIVFDFDRSEITVTSQKHLNEVANLVRDRYQKAQRADLPFKLLIQGWTDHTGSHEYNMKLSKRRSQATKQYLVKQGLPESIFTDVGLGKSFKYTNSTKQGRHMNRRAEIIFQTDGQLMDDIGIIDAKE